MTAAVDRTAQSTGNSATRAVDILIIEDDDDMRELLEHLLTSEGYAVKTAKEGGEGLACMRRASVRLVLLDLQLPGVNGYDFRNAQLRDERLAQVPVVIMSGTGNVHVAARRLNVGEYMVKPLDFGKLLAIVRRYVR